MLPAIKKHFKLQAPGTVLGLLALVVAALSLVAVFAVVTTAATATASASAGAEVHHEGDRWRDVVVVDSNICGWPSTFTSRGQFHLVDVTAQSGRVSFTVHEVNYWTLVITDDPSVPEPFRGATWRGREIETDRISYDPATGQMASTYRVFEAEGPFHTAFRGRDTFIADGNGILRVETSIGIEQIDCEALLD